MRINDVEIWGFGKLVNKKISFSEGLNVVCGDNERGKSSLQWYILSMFFGMKGKRVLKDGSFTPEKRFEPWHTEKYGGSLSFKSRAGESYTIERNFKRKSCIVYNKNLEDISDTFGISKTKGIDIMGKLFEIGEELFLRTSVILQREGRIDKKSKEELISQIVNIYQSGYEDISIKSAQTALKKAVNDYVGTNRTDKKPLNIIEEKLNTVRNRIRQLELDRKLQESLVEKIENLKERNIDIENRINTLKKHLPLIEKALNIRGLKKELGIIEGTISRMQDINARKKKEEAVLEGQRNIADRTDDEKKQLEEETSTRISRIKIFLFTFAGISVAAGILTFADLLFSVAAGFFLLLTGIAALRWIILKKKAKYLADKKQSEIDEVLRSIYNMEEYIVKLKESASEKLMDLSSFMSAEIKSTDDIRQREKGIHKEINRYQTDIRNHEKEYGVDISEYEGKEQIYSITDTLNKERTENLITIRELETKLTGEREKEDKLQQFVEEKEELSQTRENLIELKAALELSLKLLDESAEELKSDFTPGLVKEMGKTISSITDNKYSKISTDSSLMLRVVETNEGGIRDVLNLSSGAIDQMYMILRLALSNIISKNREEMPLIFDEPFMQYDDRRTKNFLEILKKAHNSRQVIIFTCKERESEIISDIYKSDMKVIKL